MGAVVLKLFLLKVKCQRIHLNQKYQLQLLSKSQQNIFRTIRMLLDISVYATADGYSASDKAEATLYWINANLDNGTNINQVRTRGVVVSAHDGIISLSGS